jgi:UDP-4-amino-4,6-dideoxy-N-acetyl-beta-L-altrosamine N-acetyltransferase
MYTDVEYNLDNQKRWFEKISSMPTEKHWVISIKGDLAGVISLNEIDYTNKKTSSGFYIGDDKYKMYGGFIAPYLYNYVFNDLNLHKITAEVMEGNSNIMKIHKLHGYREIGFYKDHIFKYDTFHDVHVFELLKEQWEQNSKKYEKYTSKFED